MAEDRREIEDGLKSRKYLGVTSTNALELGIDVGSLDAVIISGFPGSMISTWQQGGRSGRGNQKSLVILVAFENQLDQYFMKNPEFFFDKPHENVVIDLNNEKLLNNHIICAANELPIAPEKIEEVFGVDEEFINNIVQNRDLRKSAGLYIYPYDDNPAFEFSLDQISNEIFSVMNGNQLIEKIERSQMYREAHEGAILINKELGNLSLVLWYFELGSMHSNINPQKTATQSIFCKSWPLGLNTSIGCLNLPNCFFNTKLNVRLPVAVNSLGEKVKNAISSAEPSSPSSMTISSSPSAKSNPLSL